MLTDIFARRYEQPSMWETFYEEHRRLLVQGCQLLNDLCPYSANGKESEHGKDFWTRIHDLLARELGLKELSPRYWGFHNKQDQWQSSPYTTAQMCETWMLQAFDGKTSADRFIKERLSLVEIGFRQHENFVAGLNAKLADNITTAEKLDQTINGVGLRMPGKSADGVRAANVNLNAKFHSGSGYLAPSGTTILYSTFTASLSVQHDLDFLSRRSSGRLSGR